MRSVKNVWVAVSVCAAVCFGGAGVARAGGGVNPPVGPVAPTMHTLDELYAQSARAAGGASTTAIGDSRFNSSSMTITGAAMGPIIGEDLINGVPDLIRVVGFSHEMTVPYDPATGLLTSHPSSTPFVVIKQQDLPSPSLYQAMLTGDNLTVVLRLYRTGPTLGVEDNYLTYRLLNAHIVEIRPYTKAVDILLSMHLEEVSFVYSQIEWTFEQTGNVVTSSW